jgi:hypothetical protein
MPHVYQQLPLAFPLFLLSKVAGMTDSTQNTAVNYTSMAASHSYFREAMISSWLLSEFCH